MLRTLSRLVLFGSLSLLSLAVPPSLAQQSSSFILKVAPNVDVNRQTGSQAEEAVAVNPANPKNVFILSNSSSANALMAAYTMDAGATWSFVNPATGAFATGSDGYPQACCDPSVSFDEYGNLFVCYLDSNLTTGPNIDVLLSADGGKTFSVLTRVRMEGPITATDWMPSKLRCACRIVGQFDQPTLVAAQGAVWITVHNSATNGIVCYGATVNGLGAVGAFGSARTVPGSAGGNFGDIAIGPTGQVAVTWQDAILGPSPANLFVSVNPTGLGGSFGNPVKVTTTNVIGFDPIPAQPNRTVDAEVGLAWDRSGGPNNGRLYMMYTDEFPLESADLDIELRHSDDNGVTWSGPLRVNDDATTNSQFLPKISLDQASGNLAVSWYDCRNDLGKGGSGDTDGKPNDDAQYWAAVSTDGGKSFTPNVQVSAGTSNGADTNDGFDFGDYTGLAYFAGLFHPSWADNSNSTGNNPEGALHGADIFTTYAALSSTTPPGNDSFATPQVLSNNFGTVTGSNIGATKEAGEPKHAGNPGGASVWYNWTPTVSRPTKVFTTGSNFDTLLAVYTGSAVNGLTMIASNDDEPGKFTSSLVFNAVAGTTYSIAVDGVLGATGNIVLGYGPLSPPPAPTGLTATVQQNQVTLTWNPVPMATSYNVKRATMLAGPYTTIQSGITGTTYVDKTVLPGATYFYVVSASGDGGEGPNSAPAKAQTFPAVPLDFNGDGKADLLWQNQTTGGVYYWLMNGPQYTGAGGFIIESISTDWKVVGTPDLNGDGQPDLLWQNQKTGGVYYWIINGAQYTGQGGYIIPSIDLAWKVVSTPDLNGDRMPDILWQNQKTGGVYYWLMNGAQFSGNGGYITPTMSLDWKVVSTAELDNDGHPDILWQNQSTGGVYYWLLNGTQYSGNGGAIIPAIDLQWKVVGSADLNGDGHADLIWQNQSNGGVYYWLLNGTQYIGGDYIIPSIDLAWKVVAPH